ncbi:MAG TPA: hypothetical protein VJJ21_05220 [Candidatus Nanoarchaeia archaeon]|nr:hypothetical protein [Candidatus Nanoarchaeia archaeon]
MRFFKSREEKLTGRVEKLKQKMYDSQIRVLDLYQEFDIAVGPVPLLGISPLFATKLSASQDYLLHREVDLDHVFPCEGAYSETYDVILYNQLHCERISDSQLDATLVHEYAHRLMRVYFAVFDQHLGRIREIRQQSNSLQLDQSAHEGEKSGNGPRSPEELLERIETSLVDCFTTPRTPDELLLGQFQFYFNEMWAKSVEMYLTGQTHDRLWMVYSGANVGTSLIEDYDFFKKIQSTFHTLFFERLFSHGLHKTARRIPFVYSALKFQFDQHYEKRLPEDIAIRL